MLVNAFQGFVHQQHYDFENRKAHVLAAKEYYKDFHHLCQLYGLAEVCVACPDVLFNVHISNQKYFAFVLYLFYLNF